MIFLSICAKHGTYSNSQRFREEVSARKKQSPVPTGERGLRDADSEKLPVV